MEYPEYALIGNREYKINTDFRIALKCFEVIDDDEICDIERSYAIIGLLYDEEIPANYLDDALKKAIFFLECGREQNKNTQKKDMDFIQDENYILASFMSDYRIDLTKEEYMHWWKYCSLISGLSENSILNRIRDLRNFDITQIKDSKEKAKIIKAKESVALKEKISKEDKKIIDEFESLFI